MLNFLATRPALTTVVFFVLVGGAFPVGIGAAAVFSLPAGVGVGLVAVLAAGSASVGIALIERVNRVAQRRLEEELSAKYGVALRRVQSDVWSIDGTLRQASLVYGTRTVLVGGRELEVRAG